MFPTAVCFWVSISGSRGLVPGMRPEFRGCAGFRDLSPGFRDFWNLVCLPSLCFFLWSIRVSGLHQGSGILGLLSPIIVFFLVVYQGSGIFGTLSPIIVFVLWSIRARDFIRVSGFLDFCFPSLCFFWFRDLSPEFQDLSPGFRDSWTFVSHHCVFSCGLSGLRDFWNLVSHHCVCSVVHQGVGLHQGSGILGLLSLIIVFLLVPGLVSRVPGLVSRVPGLVSRVPGLLEPCLPSQCLRLKSENSLWPTCEHHWQRALIALDRKSCGHLFC